MHNHLQLCTFVAFWDLLYPVFAKYFPKYHARWNKYISNSRRFFWEPPGVGLAPTGVWRVPPIPHCNWRTLPSSQTPSLPALSFTLPPPRLRSFCKAPGGGAQAGGGGEGSRGARGWGVEGGGLQAALGARPTSGGTRELFDVCVFVFNSNSLTKRIFHVCVFISVTR